MSVGEKVTATLKHEKLFSWSIVFDVVVEGGQVFVFYQSAPDVILRILLSEESVAVLKKLRDQIETWMQQEVTLNGTVAERLEKRVVTRTEEVEEWVSVG